MADFSNKKENMAARDTLALQKMRPRPVVDVRTLVLDALNEAHLAWRTAEGIASEKALSLDVVRLELASLSDVLIRSSFPDEHGRPRYTTFQNYRAHAGILRRVLSALSDQVR